MLHLLAHLAVLTQTFSATDVCYPLSVASYFGSTCTLSASGTDGCTGSCSVTSPSVSVSSALTMPSIPVTAAVSVLPCKRPQATVTASGEIDLPGSSPSATVSSLIQTALTTAANQAAASSDADFDVQLTYTGATNKIDFLATIPPGQSVDVVIPIYTFPATGNFPGIGSYVPSLTVTYELKLTSSQPSYARLQFSVEVDLCIEITGLAPLLANEKV